MCDEINPIYNAKVQKSKTPLLFELYITSLCLSYYEEEINIVKAPETNRICLYNSKYIYEDLKYLCKIE